MWLEFEIRSTEKNLYWLFTFSIVLHITFIIRGFIQSPVSLNNKCNMITAFNLYLNLIFSKLNIERNIINGHQKLHIHTIKVVVIQMPNKKSLKKNPVTNSKLSIDPYRLTGLIIESPRS